MNRNKIKMENLNNAPPIPFVVATLLGTIKKPKLTNVTTGCFVGKSLVFHTQEDSEYVEHNGEMLPFGKFFEYHRNNVNEDELNFDNGLN